MLCWFGIFHMINLAVIIPTLNEEHFIGYLLDCLINQSLQPKEIVIVDACSSDKTIDQIKLRQKKLPALKVFQIPKFTIARQRNFGVSKTSAPHLLFLDADTELRDKDVLKKYLAEVKKRGCDLAIATNKPTSTYWKDRLFFKVMDLTFKLAKPFWPMATSINMYVSRTMFNKAGGFDESIAVGEDFEFVYRIVKKGGKFSILSSPKIHTSPRRFKREGRIKFSLKTTRSFLQIVRHGFKNNAIEYEFGHFTLTDQSDKT